MHTAHTAPLDSVSDRPRAEAVYRKVTVRLLPFLFICYVFAYMDRANIGFAHLQFSRDVGLSDASFGLGVGLFYVGYMLFEVPSNLWLERVGVRKTLMRIMALWGLVSAATAFVQTPTQFYIARILLGAAEAGFFPGVILYFTYWFPAARRARVTAIFMTAICVSGIISGPVSGLILNTLSGFMNVKGWQWLFILEGLPSVVAGLFAYIYLTDRPEQATWLSADEKDLLLGELRHDAQAKAARAHASIWVALKEPKFYFLTFAYFSVPWASIVVHIWAPSVIQKSGVTNYWHIGLLSAIPYVAGAAAMYLLGRNSDRMLERRWHFMASSVMAALGVVLLPAFASHPAALVVLLCIATAGYLGMLSLFWTIPPAYLSSTVAASGIGLISSLGQFGGISAPTVIGFASTHFGSSAPGLYAVAIVSILGGLAVVLGIPARAISEK
ncbi:MFS transporter [Paraburkholderia sp. Tr-20389]|uniref:MFS transporter n=1 Tax=Paraburkholderia sp. Tr-20389 TaxID=2703903 RepID=UPI00197CEF9C|nr:MFS transporter [Paraburkholderia sp. Tr-20389]MBN3752041.1 MFS transporter [Paraburkholderia sp. Tr-20389]